MEIDIEGPGAFAVEVVSVSQYQDVLEGAAKEGAIVRATLMLEDSNPYDDQAVGVHISGRRAGYLSRANARLYRADLATAGEPSLTVHCKGKIVGGFENARGERAHFGLNLDLLRLAP